MFICLLINLETVLKYFKETVHLLCLYKERVHVYYNVHIVWL